MDSAELQAVKASQSGNPAQFTVLYERYVTKIYRFIYFKTFHRETAEDLTSLTFMKALEHINDFNAAQGNFSAWLYRIAHNTVIDHYRTGKSNLNLDEVFALAAPQNVAEQAQANLALDKVKAFMQALDQDMQELLLMRLWQGLSYQEIAEITGKSEGSLKMAVSRALKALRRQVPLAVLGLIFVL